MGLLLGALVFFAAVATIIWLKLRRPVPACHVSLITRSLERHDR